MAPDTDQTIDEFAASLRRQLQVNSVRNLIVDIRHNNGGNSLSYVDLLRTIVEFSGDPRNQVYVIIGRGTYSAATNFMTDMERLARPIFVGEKTAQGGKQYGDCSVIRLPYSGASLCAPGIRWQLSTPYDERRGIVPHVPVQLTAKSYFSGRDDVLDTVLRLIEEKRQTR